MLCLFFTKKKKRLGLDWSEATCTPTTLVLPRRTDTKTQFHASELSRLREEQTWVLGPQEAGMDPPGALGRVTAGGPDLPSSSDTGQPWARGFKFKLSVPFPVGTEAPEGRDPISLTLC